MINLVVNFYTEMNVKTGKIASQKGRQIVTILKETAKEKDESKSLNKTRDYETYMIHDL